MQANNDIDKLFEGFEKEFEVGDWSAIESQVKANNKKYKISKLKYKWGVILGSAACVLLGFVHFNSMEKPSGEAIAATEEIQLPEVKNTPTITEEKQLEKEVETPTAETKATARKTASSTLNGETSSQKPAPTAAVEQPKVTLPDVVLGKNSYCIGEQLKIDVNPKRQKALTYRLNDRKIKLKKLEALRFHSAGEFTLAVYDGDKETFNQKIEVQAPPARIGYNKNYYVNNPYVNFVALNSSKNANYTWYVDNELIASSESFQHTFASKGVYSIKMVVVSSGGCKDSTIKSVRILRGYNLMASSIFNPKKEKWLPPGLKKDDISFKLRVVDHNGSTVFTSTNPNTEWDGTISENASAKDGDIFYWVAQVTDKNGRVSEYGNSVLINSTLH